MNISFKSKKLEKSFNDSRRLEREYGTVRASKIRLRMNALRAAKCLNDFAPPKSGPERCHEISEGLSTWHLSVDLDHPYRLIFAPDHEPVPVKADGGLDWTRVTAVKILGVEDTHG